MRRLRPRSLTALALGVFGAALLWSTAILAQPAKQPHDAKPAVTAHKTTAQKASKKKSSAKKGRAKKATPKKKKKKTPESRKAPKAKNSAPTPANPEARASIAGRPVQEESNDAPELEELREVEDILFWDQQGATPTSSQPEIVSSGLPPIDAPTSPSLSGSSSPDSSSPDAPGASPGASPGTDLRWMAQLSKPDLPFRWDVRLIRYLDYFKNNPRGRNFARALLKKSGRYDAKIREALRDKNLPEDLVYLSLAESGMNPRIVSRAGAAGLWQFMPKAGKAYGLRIDKHVDERLDPHRSTQAAVRFLKDLHNRFGRWELAMAAYNMGHGGLLSSIRKYNTNDFWELSELEAGIPYETALYVPKIVALAFVARNKEVFGCADLQLDAAEPFDVSSAPEPVPKSSPSAPAPRAQAPVIAKASASSEDAESSERSTDTLPVTVKWGESLDAIAATYGMTESRLRALNNLKDPMPPRPGTKILVPKGKTKSLSSDPLVAVVPSSVTPPAGKKRVFYEVVWGDKLGDVARVLGATTDELCQWNNLDRTANLHSRMVLQAFVPEDASLADVRVTRDSAAQVLVVGTPQFFDHFEAKNGRMRTVVAITEGDTLRSLAKKHGISVGMLERINHKSRSADLKAGDTLVVYTKRTATSATPLVAPAASPAPGTTTPGAEGLDVAEDRTASDTDSD